MNKTIRLLVEGFFDDEIFDVEDDIKSNLEDLGRYYEYNVGDFYYKGRSKKPYAVCCGESKLFNDNKPRFCLLKHSKKLLKWSTDIKAIKLVKELGCFEFKYFLLKTFNNFKHIDEDGYGNTLIIKNNYDITKFPAFEWCINLGNNVYLPAIDELLMMYLNKDKLGKYSFSGYSCWSSTLYSATSACSIDTNYGDVYPLGKYYNFPIHPFFHID